MIHNLSSQNSIANQFLAQLRDVNVQNNRLLFRENMERLGNIFAYEISKHLDYKEVEVETPLGIAKSNIPDSKIVLCTILRAGLPLYNGILDFFDDANNSFVAAYRKNHKDGTFEISLEYITCPDLTGATLILIDPMLATGASIEKTLESLSEYGKYEQLHIVSIIASSFGVNHIKRLYPNAHLWMAAEDEELTAKSYIVPGLGDAGDLAFGKKLQE
ncbi:MAG: uracil phosphoribosyltransferase [Saprospiraceae bacterium]|jgi:uracil phosphoribosyltransferase|nr:uracil phosphoribosyltransferase [Saprospiraceae bacterium]MBP6238565.1 uracil phosphoribosyltransferase [Saprospiraceae bacterium]MBP6567674.1 uracil phosphoribosyltransferase [Saprospiraceae bacterium]MBP9196115.1 uracil phosphoribosyltransferase [Saprospiraceae bacterium]